ncbi:Multi-copper polyphenol oxidoreductase, laccase [Crinalium epipsammum PCC 9333]|uniref:Purine nucleoside phosphorylase n=1 Tax=Crinalium epipsammum PCC 9333 TaxID=1173022 RepID=K9VV30_9CYAN|nr:peptidoglycan editing factor PgeF [Crinalium epipsammum]AFZ11821.1 Multi-copper polyphenol oxidoreductase, laccase [Crinalium epipsammum PCC 9333]
MDSNIWHWHRWEGLPYLTCSLLEPWSHGFFTSLFSPRTPLELVEVLQPEAEVYRVKQVHGNTVLTPSMIGAAMAEGKEEQEGGLLPADGLVTEQANQAIWVCSADCTPVLIADRHTGQVAAIHAGWRGTASKIVPEAIAQLVAAGSKLENLLVAMGPAISGEVYQVSVDVGVEVGASIIPANVAHSHQAILDILQELPDSPILPDPEVDKVRLDVRKVNAIQLAQLGIKEEQIAIAPHCTYQEPDKFFSYRRSQLKKVQWSGIVSLHE